MEKQELLDSKYTAVYDNKKRHKQSGELNSFALAVAVEELLIPKDLCSKKIITRILALHNFNYITGDSEKYQEDSIPNRYFTLDNHKYFYMDGKYYKDTLENELGDYDEALEKIKEELGLSDIISQ